MNPPDTELLRVDGLKVHFPLTRGVLFKRTVGQIKAVDGVSFTLRRGETLGLVGESGCGKTTTSLAVLRMQPLSGGRIVFEGDDISAADNRQARFRRRMQMVYQDPYGSLDPRMKVRDIVGEPLIVHGVHKTRAEYRERVATLLASVGLLPDMAERYPHEFSGGQRQRIGIARALALEPSLVICDEPVSALDVSIQAQVINVLMELQQRLKLSYLFVAHDQLGAERQRAGDADALTLAARELVREVGHLARPQADAGEQGGDLGLAFLAVAHAVDQQRLRHDIARCHARVQRGERILEDDLHVAPRQPHARLRETEDVLAAEDHLA